MNQFDFEVHAGDKKEGTFTATVHIPVESPQQQSDVLHYIRSLQLRKDFMNGWASEHAPGYGVSLHGGPRPVFRENGVRESGVSAYEQDFRLTKPV
jgi:hypothetical protein